MRVLAATALCATLLPAMALAQSTAGPSAPNAPAVTTPGPSDTTAATPGRDMTPGLTTPDSTVVPPAGQLGPRPGLAPGTAELPSASPPLSDGPGALDRDPLTSDPLNRDPLGRDAYGRGPLERQAPGLPSTGAGIDREDTDLN